jgi:hypothetical protein
MKNILGWLMSIIVGPLIVTIIAGIVLIKMSGGSLSGLATLRGWIDLIFNSPVPMWAFVVLLAVAGGLAWYVITHRPTRLPKPQVHFVQDPLNNGWSPSDTAMNVNIGGTFTFTGLSYLTVLKICLKNTKQIGPMVAKIFLAGQGPTDVGKLELPPGAAVRAVIYFRVSPNKGTPGKDFKAKAIFRDNHNEDYPLDMEAELEYQGPTVPTRPPLGPAVPATPPQDPTAPTTDAEGMTKKLVMHVMRGKEKLLAYEVSREGLTGMCYLVERHFRDRDPASKTTASSDDANAQWLKWYREWKDSPGGFGGSFGTGLDGQPPF